MSDSPLSSRAFAITLGVLVALFAGLFATEQIYNYDVWWHLATGRLILEQGAVPTADPFSFSTAGAAWVPHYWGSDVLLALGARAVGLSGLILAKALVVAAAFGVAFVLAVRLGASPALAALAVGGAVPIARFRFLLRPHVAMFLLVVVFLLVLATWRRERPWRILWLTLPMGLWANLHASFVLGPLLVGCLLVDELASGWCARRRGEDRSWRPTLALGVCVGLLALETLATPLGVALPRWVISDFLTKSVSRSFEIEEHLPLRWGQYPAYWTLLGLTIASYMAARRRPRLLWLLVLGAVTVLALGSVRYVALASLVSAPLLARNAQGLLVRWWPARLRLRPRAELALAAVALLSLGGLAFRATFAESKVYRFGLGVNTSRYPGGAVRFLEDQGIRGDLINSWKLGGYLLWHLPESRTFLDGRSLDRQIQLHSRLSGMPPAQRAGALAAFHAQAAVVSPGDGLLIGALVASPEFGVAYFDDQAIVFVPTGPGRAGPPVFRRLRPERFDFKYLVPLALGPEAGQVAAELERATALAPHAFKPAFLYGLFHEARKSAAAVTWYRRAAEANPRLAFVHYDLGRRAGRFALGVGRVDDARWLLEAAVACKPSAELYFLLGIASQQLKDVSAAEAAYREALALGPGEPNALSNLGFVLLDAGRAVEAASLFRRALAVAPQREGIAYGLALSLDAADDPEAASAWLRFLERFPTSRWAAKARERVVTLGAPERSDR